MADLNSRLTDAQLKYRRSSINEKLLKERIAKLEKVIIHKDQQKRNLEDKIQILENSKSLRLSRLLPKFKNFRRIRANVIELASILFTPTTKSTTEFKISKNRYSEQLTAILPNEHNDRINALCILDEFSYQSFKFELNLMPIGTDWQNHLDKIKAHNPEMLFVESAWEGKNGEWRNKISSPSEDLKNLISFCDENSIKTVFWNKEDPAHFSTFLPTASIFKYVFTTDINTLSEYKQALGHDDVFFLPFGVQPQLFNPISSSGSIRKRGVFFAGAFYKKYLERANDMIQIIPALSDLLPITIYDRNHNTLNDAYKFPDSLQKYIIGKLRYHETPRAYKNFEFGLNFNSVKTSSSMFARRVFELAASNTFIISNYSPGIRSLFSDSIISSDDPQNVKSRLNRLMKSENDLIAKCKSTAMRITLNEHTCSHRLDTISNHINLSKKNSSELPVVHVLLLFSTERERLNNQKNRERQLFSNATYTETPASSLMDVYSSIQHEWVAFFFGDDYYGRHYLSDMASSLRFPNIAGVSKPNHFSIEKKEIKFNPSEHFEYSKCTKLKLRTALIPKTSYEKVLSRLKEYTFTDEAPVFLASNRFDYCRNYIIDKEPTNFLAQETLDRKISSELACPSPRIDMQMLLEKANSKRINLMEKNDSPSNKPLISLGASKNAEMSLNWMPNGDIEVSANLKGAHQYIYMKGLVARDLFFSKAQTVIHVKATPGMKLSFVIIYFSASEIRLSHQIIACNTNGTLRIPDQTAKVKIGFRAASSGSCLIKGVYKDSISHQSIVTLPKNQPLVLTNNYPSYDDLYRNAFLHTRVKAYREHQVHPAVFVMKNAVAVNLVQREFQNVDIIEGGQQHLDYILRTHEFTKIIIHFLTPQMWEVLKKYPAIEMIIWCHGSDIQPWWRRKFLINNNNETHLKHLSELRMKMWKDVFTSQRPFKNFVFVSNVFAHQTLKEDYKIDNVSPIILPNPIDDSLFKYRKKNKQHSRKILSIRPYASNVYANDLSVEAILILSKTRYFANLEFLICGDGVLFEEITAPLRKFKNVALKKGFMRQEEIATIHKDFGVFLCPSRMDTQGVSRDEAMSSGLVPIVSDVGAVTEFVDETCSYITQPESALEIAHAIIDLYNNPSVFLQKSASTQKNLYNRTIGNIIVKEVALINEDNGK